MSGYSQLSQADDAELLESDALPPSYSNPFHNPRTPAPYPPTAPPSFLQSPSATVPLSTFRPLPAPSATNHLAITHKHTSIRGTYCIDTGIVVPTHLLDPVPNSLWTVLADALGAGGEAASRERPNAAFATEAGQIDLVLHIKGGGRAVVNVNAGSGSAVRVAVASLDAGTSLSLTVNAKSTVLISLPSSFRGLIKGGSEIGLLTFSDALKPETATFSVDQQSPLAGRYFVGNWQEAVAASGPGASAEWSTSTSLTPGGGEERKGPLLEYESSTADSSTESSGCFSGSSSAGQTAASTSAAPAPAPWSGDVVTVTSVHGSITIETMEERAERIRKRDESWGTSVWGALGACCGSVGVLTLACFGCPAH